jgi:hypothetical protein
MSTSQCQLRHLKFVGDVCKMRIIRLLMYMDRKQNQSVAIAPVDINFHYIILADVNVEMLSIMQLVYQFNHGAEKLE